MATFDGDRLRAARKRRRLSRHQLADAVGVGGGTLRDWELGKRPPTPAQIKALADLLIIEPEASYRASHRRLAQLQRVDPAVADQHSPPRGHRRGRR